MVWHEEGCDDRYKIYVSKTGVKSAESPLEDCNLVYGGRTFTKRILVELPVVVADGIYMLIFSADDDLFALVKHPENFIMGDSEGNVFKTLLYESDIPNKVLKSFIGLTADTSSLYIYLDGEATFESTISNEIEIVYTPEAYGLAIGLNNIQSAIAPECGIFNLAIADANCQISPQCGLTPINIETSFINVITLS